jgi:hypothetical protein
MSALLEGYPLPDGLAVEEEPCAWHRGTAERAAGMIRRLVVRLHARRALDREQLSIVMVHYRAHEAEAIQDAEALLADLERAVKAARGHA